MNDADITSLKYAFRTAASVNGCFIAWAPGQMHIQTVSRIGAAPVPAPGDEPEPSEVAYVGSRGDYVALCNCSLSDFIVATRLGG